MPNSRSPIESQILAACVLEATARKPGNVHPTASFQDVKYSDFLLAAELATPALAQAGQLGVGRAVLEAGRAVRGRVSSNANLGIALLFAPLAAVPAEQTLADGITGVLEKLNNDDARYAYEAILAAKPGGLGTAPEQDVADVPAGTLLESMQLAADRDRIAAEYATGFAVTLQIAVPFLAENWRFPDCWEEAVIGLQLLLLSLYPDTLIARKCGQETANEAANRARVVLDAGGTKTDTGRAELHEFDRWLRADGNRRNPGTTADLIAAALFAAFRDGRVECPSEQQIDDIIVHHS